MEKRIHSKRSSSLTLRHYLFHFKWPLLGFVTMFMFVLLTQINVTSMVLPYIIQEQQFDPSDIDVIYPIDVFNKKANTSINIYFLKKDEMKILADANAADKKQKMILSLNKTQEKLKSFLILESTKVFTQPRFCSYTNEKIFGDICPYKNCKYTCDEKYEKDAQVLLMHKSDLDYKKLDSMKRNPEQIWLLWHDESNQNLSEMNKYKFNWTLTYRIDAEASIGAYGITIVKQKPWSLKQLNSWIDQQFIQRHNQAVWFVSNCQPQKRLKKFESLRKYYPIAAFGKCISSNKTFSYNAQLQPDTTCIPQSICEKTYLLKSKFYLAFESQTCTDYITEKFWRTLAVGAIPIVSGPILENYLRIAPPHSFIHVDNYSTDNELAQTLNLIATNRSLFEKYHQWRRYYDVYYQAKDVDPYRFCELCYRLNTNQQRMWYENLNDWFLDKC